MKRAQPSSRVETGILDAGSAYVVGCQSLSDSRVYRHEGSERCGVRLRDLGRFVALSKHGTLDQLPNPWTSIFFSMKWNNMTSLRELMGGF